jgi:hypothetical protein
MAGLDSPALSAARAKVASALAEFAQVQHDERIEDEKVPAFDETDAGPVFVIGFAIELEYLIPDWVSKEITGNMVIIPDDQSPAWSRGLFDRGADAFSNR